MPRHAIGDRRLLSLDCIIHMKELLGTMPNAYARLGFSDDLVTFKQFREATNRREVQDTIAEAIEGRWEAYQDAIRLGILNRLNGWTLDPLRWDEYQEAISQGAIARPQPWKQAA